MNEARIRKGTTMKRTTTRALLGLACLMAMPSIAHARYRDGMNWYAYVGNHPITDVDPYGLWKIERAGDAQATAIAEKADTLNGLGAMLKLEASEIPRWADGTIRAPNNGVRWNNGWRTADGKFASPRGAGRAGASAESAVWDAVEAKPGWEVVRGRVSVRDASGQLRVYDGAAISPRGRVIGLEVKSGSGRLTPAQRAFDTGLNSSGTNTLQGVGRSSNLEIRRALEVRR